MSEPTLTLGAVAARAGVSPATVRRWVKEGLVPQHDGAWNAAAAAQVRIIARLRARGHTIEDIRQATDSGRLAINDLEDFLPVSEGRYTLKEAARATGLKADVIERLYGAMGLSVLSLEAITEGDMEMLRYGAAILSAGFPLVALLQILRVYGQALAQIADTEVRLVHMYVHEPLIREGVPGLKIAEEMDGLVRELLPFATPFMTYLHGHFLTHFVEQDVVGHMEADVEAQELEEGRLRVTIAFADLAGYTRLTEERGEEVAVGAVERFVEAVVRTLPIDARVIKSLGDEVMIIGADPIGLTQWAVDFQSELPPESPAPRIGVHHGEALYRDGDYYGREVNRAARVVARAAGGEVLVSASVVDAASASERLVFELIGGVVLKGFSEPTELYLAGKRET
jgi:adenylate cyclase